MAFCRLVFSLLVLSVIQIYAVYVPAYIWGDIASSSLKANPLSKVSSEEFTSLLKQELEQKSSIIVFVEETLSVEDFSRKDGNGETSFPYLHEQLNDAVYLPAVEDSLNALKVLAKSEKVTFFNLEDAREGESRQTMLRRHNDFMESKLSDLEDENVVAIYTAKYPSWTIPETHSRVRRQAEAGNTTASYSVNGLRFYAKNVRLYDGTNTTDLSSPQSSSSDFNATQLEATFNFNNIKITLNFRQSAGYWFFDTVTLDVTNGGNGTKTLTAANEEVYALSDFSYRCAPSVKFTDDTNQYSLYFEDMKIQPFFANTNETTQFGDSLNCVGFFSAPIWSGLFVVFILLAITFYGIMMMMDIRTMDRFDDPKGKTITINTAE